MKQFYIGGSNSVRAFSVWGLGPGSYRIPDSIAAKSFLDQAGDIKLEANTEYRFPIISILKGALFIDAGNIWLLQDDPNRPGGKFSSKTFLDEVAVGTGFGLRLDLSFFILRFDLAFPLRVPYLPKASVGLPIRLISAIRRGERTILCLILPLDIRIELCEWAVNHNIPE